MATARATGRHTGHRGATRRKPPRQRPFLRPRRLRYARWRQAGRQYRASGRLAYSAVPQMRHLRR
ncbi:MAG: hypothetical protein WD534_11270 [Phycisphaeraceae bacterium]